MVLRYWIGPTKTARQEALQNHELFVEGWKDAIRAAEAAQEGGYWPVSVDGKFSGLQLFALTNPAMVRDLERAGQHRTG